MPWFLPVLLHWQAHQFEDNAAESEGIRGEWPKRPGDHSSAKNSQELAARSDHAAGGKELHSGLHKETPSARLHYPSIWPHGLACCDHHLPVICTVINYTFDTLHYCDNYTPVICIDYM